MRKMLSMMLIMASFVCFTACSEEEEFKITVPQITLKVGESYQFKGGGGLKWYSYEPLVASVDKNGKLTAYKVGSTWVGTGSEVCCVDVEPRYDYYEPLFGYWGTSRNHVKTYMEESSLHLASEDGTYLQYKSYLGSLYLVYQYQFENYDDLCVCGFGGATNLFGDALLKYVEERYLYSGMGVISGYTARMYTDIWERGYIFYINMGSATMIMYTPLDKETRAIGDCIPSIENSIKQLESSL